MTGRYNTTTNTTPPKWELGKKPHPPLVEMEMVTATETDTKEGVAP